MFEMYNSPQSNLPLVADWHWELCRCDRSVVAISPRGFDNKADCEADIHFVMLADYSTPIVERKLTEKINDENKIYNLLGLKKFTK